MTLISFVDICKSFGTHTIFTPVTGIIRRGERVGVVGPNGAGKTTLCRVLAGLESPDSGQVHINKSVRCRYMEQEPSLESRCIVIDELINSSKEIQQLETRIEDYRSRLDMGEKLTKAELESYGELMERFQRLEGYSLASRAEKLLVGLGLGEEFFSSPVGSLSGGQLSRLVLAKTLIEEPELLFLDEPTNHLDLKGIEFLENFLVETSSTVVVISHDREFLDRVTGRTVEILDSRVRLFNGNYSSFREWVRAETETLGRAQKNYERKVKKIEEFIRRNIYGQKSRQAQSRRKMLERLSPPPKSSGKTKAPKWNIEVAARGGSVVLEARDIKKAFPGNPPLFENLDLVLTRGETLAVIGDNGTGKSTLFHVLAGKLPPDCGTVNWGHEVSVAYLPQQVEHPCSDSQRVIDYMARQAPEMTAGQLRSYLARFLFSGERVEQSLDTLSEGEFRRLVLAGLIHSRANLLLLDEPTNHLDIYSREALQEALIEYHGTLVLISHDRRLLAALADRFLEFNAPGHNAGTGDKIVEYNGDYSYYKLKREKLGRAAEKTEKPPKAKRPNIPEPAARGNRQRPISKNRLQKIKKRRNILEREIAVLEDRKSSLELELAAPDTYKAQGRPAELSTAVEKVEERIAQAYKEWEKLLEYD